MSRKGGEKSFYVSISLLAFEAAHTSQWKASTNWFESHVSRFQAELRSADKVFIQGASFSFAFHLRASSTFLLRGDIALGQIYDRLKSQCLFVNEKNNRNERKIQLNHPRGSKNHIRM